MSGAMVGHQSRPDRGPAPESVRAIAAARRPRVAAGFAAWTLALGVSLNPMPAAAAPPPADEPFQWEDDEAGDDPATSRRLPPRDIGWILAAAGVGLFSLGAVVGGTGQTDGSAVTTAVVSTFGAAAFIPGLVMMAAGSRAASARGLDRDDFWVIEAAASGGFSHLERSDDFQFPPPDPGGAATIEGSLAVGGMVRGTELLLEVSYGQLNANAAGGDFGLALVVGGRVGLDAERRWAWHPRLAGGAGTMRANAEGSFRLFTRVEPFGFSRRVGRLMFRFAGPSLRFSAEPGAQPTQDIAVVAGLGIGVLL